MRVQNMTSNKGNSIANQFIITHNEFEYFQSYNSIIGRKDIKTGTIVLDPNFWDYSVTTGKYRNQFLGETKQETQKKIDSGEYVLMGLN